MSNRQPGARVVTVTPYPKATGAMISTARPPYWITISIAKRPKVALVVVLGLWLFLMGLTVFAWFFLLPQLWNGAVGWLAIIVGTFCLIFAPFPVAAVVLTVSDAIGNASSSDEVASLDAARQRVREAEDDALKRLEKRDTAGLLPLLRYSRAQLDEYYAMGLAQTKRTFHHALVAMWFGFALLVIGVMLYVGPVERLGLQRPGQSFNVLVLGSTTIIEFISALFLWFYRNTIGQLTFYYRLQIRNHNAILCFRIATSMKDADEAKRAIVNSMLDSSLAPERPDVRSSHRAADWTARARAAARSSTTAEDPEAT